jgi:hypothetical protein
MMSLARTLITGTALTILLSPLSLAFAADSTDTGSQILNGQVDLHTSESSLHVTVSNVGGDAGVSSTAGGNAIDITTMNDTHVTNSQYTSSVSIFSDLGTNASNINGSLVVQGQSTCNTAVVSTDPNITEVNSVQNCQAVDPNSSVYVDANNIGGDVSISNLAAGNTFEEDTNAPNAPITTRQINASSINANTTANIANVAGSVQVQATAVGNTGQIVHYGTN